MGEAGVSQAEINAVASAAEQLTFGGYSGKALCYNFLRFNLFMHSCFPCHETPKNSTALARFAAIALYPAFRAYIHAMATG